LERSRRVKAERLDEDRLAEVFAMLDRARMRGTGDKEREGQVPGERFFRRWVRWRKSKLVCSDEVRSSP
jgi:hypothetical protein